VKVAGTGSEGLRLAFDFSADLVLLDLMLPDMPGFDVCRQIRLRAVERQPAIVILTARTNEADRVTGFELGADDYVVKPFSVRELILRLEVRLKARRVSARPARSSSQSLALQYALPSQRIVIGALEIDPASHRLFLSGHEIRMSAQEMRLLLYLADPPGRMRTRRELLTDVWGYSPEVSSRTLDTHIKRIRDKFGDAADLLQTQRGIGYRLGDTQLWTHSQIIADEVHASSRIT
jgi:two-component system phosphate regulon response regulator PhoB